jgi:CBS domain containing-hemolysin-like protein
MPEGLFLAVVLAFASGYAVSLYALSVYVDPDDATALATGSSKRRQRQLRLLTQDPRTLTQVAAIYGAVVLIVITAAGLELMEFVIAQLQLNPPLVYVPGLVLIWLLYVLLIEYLPRRRSRRFLRQSKLRLLWLVVTVYYLISPLARFYRDSMERVTRSEPVTEEEKEEIIERAIETLADQAGISETLVEEDEKEMIGQIFRLDQTQVQEIMVPRISITGIEKRTSFADIQALVRADGHSRFPVFEDNIDRIVGILYVKDLFSNMPLPGQEFVIANYLRKPFFVPESKVIGDLLLEFRARQLHIAIVIDEYGGVAGLVTLEDILEEIVGEISGRARQRSRRTGEWR